MCTVTIIRAGEMVRVAANRDEMRRRPPAHVPFIVRTGAQQAIMPQDPQGGGTWIAVNTSGLVFALLNYHDGAAFNCSSSTPSRGLIIPSLTDCASIDEVTERMDILGEAGFAPCRLVVVSDHRVLEVVVSNGTVRADARRSDVRPLMFASSDLGDVVVDGPRRALFDRMMNGDLVGQQDAFHAHRWRDRPALSVHMSRPEACTVSTTVVEVTPRDVRMAYSAAHCDAGIAVGLVLDRQRTDHAASLGPRREHAAV